MVSKKQKDRKKKIQERQTATSTGSLDRLRASSLQQTLLKQGAESRERLKELRLLQAEHETLAKRAEVLERKLKGQEKAVADMHNNHISMRRSLTDIRELHLPEHPTYTLGEQVPCAECGKTWPCKTYRKIKTPDHVVVSSLMEMARELQSKEEQT